jgi:hypothetical protein
MIDCKGCGLTKDPSEFTKGESWCKSCRKEVNTRNNPRNNHVRRWAKLLSGHTISRLYELPKAERAKWFSLARELVASGSDFVTANTSRKVRKDGVLYIISHPRMDGYKIGRAFDADSRLNHYQTGCPRREYKLEYVSHYIEDCVQAEREVFDALAPHQMKGEWYDVNLAQAKMAILAFTS